MLKPRPQEDVESDKNGEEDSAKKLRRRNSHNESNKATSNRSTVQMIAQEIQEEVESQSGVKYDVMFQNRAIEHAFEDTDIQACLYQSKLLIDKQPHTLH